MINFDHRELGRRIRSYREKAGMSLADLAEASSVSKAYLFRLETEDGMNPSLDVLTRIGNALEVTVAELLGQPMLRLDPDQLEIPASLKAFADEEGLTSKEIETLASIKWRSTEVPRSAERWRFIWQSIKSSRALDEKPR